MQEPPWITCKFGGTSVTGLPAWQRIEATLRRRLQAGERLLVVCSAISGVSDALQGLADAAAAGRDLAEPLAAIEARHAEQAEALGVSLEACCGELLRDLRRLATGASLIAEASPRLRARVMSAGELMSTRLGAAWLEGRGLDLRWADARELLVSEDPLHTPPERRSLAAHVGHAADPALRARLDSLGVPVVLTQGFIARDREGHTVLLGRGGSDTSAAVLAARVGAARLEIFTDVPGMFTTNPRAVPAARQLRRLSYAEAQELASAGAKVLHPRCIAPAREAGIPLHVLSALRPELPGTVVSDAHTDRGPGVRAVVARRGVTLISMETPGMWQQVGFLAEVFGRFRDHGLSIDLIATSETSVTVSLDPSAAEPRRVQGLLEDLEPLCRARRIGPVAVVSLVGRGIRTILHELGPALARFEDRRVHLLSQAASDLNLSVVVEEEQVDALVRDLHAHFFGGAEEDPDLGPSWAELQEGQPGPAPGLEGWWTARRDALLEEAARGTPAFVYDVDSVEQAAAQLGALRAVDRVLFAVKANPYPPLLRLLHAAGLGFECVSPHELRFVTGLLGPLPPDRLLFTPNFAPAEEYEEGFALGATVTLDSVYPLRAWPERFAGREVFVRLDPGKGRGHHRFVKTAGSRSKFGVPAEDFEELLALVARHGVRVRGLHAHAGSGIRDADAWAEKAAVLASAAERLPDVEVLDLGGGLGVPERAGQAPLDLEALDASLLRFREAYPRFKLWLEPGRFLVARAGVLLARVTQVKEKGARSYVGVDVGMNSLIRPALYGAWHEILNLSRPDAEPAMTADVVGPICESGDVLGHGRRLPETVEGDVLLIATAGAYGRAMSSHYNLRPPAREVMLPAAPRPEAG
ncbi:MAG: bifunctional aspartate kinase/diaminopimelate decarboxylase [Alphaproteobacteria bacterium]|nr:bifunctional aspartate kinase/diaminopimelate decarboxylase [Alphaproteobacteria bacterium]